MPPRTRTMGTQPALQRKINKPIAEKKRRARINNSLLELKNILLEVVRDDGLRNSRLEKADILEMAVAHLKKTSKREAADNANQSQNATDQFRAGYVDCTAEITRFLGANEHSGNGLRDALFQHLAKAISTLPSAKSLPRYGCTNFSSSPENCSLPTGVTPTGCFGVGVHCQCMCAHVQCHHKCPDVGGIRPSPVQPFPERSQHSTYSIHHNLPRQLPFFIGEPTNRLQCDIDTYIKGNLHDNNLISHDVVEGVASRDNINGRNYACAGHWRPW